MAEWNLDYSDLKACFINTTLKPSGEVSHTEALMKTSMAIMEGRNVSVDYIRAADHQIAFGVYPDMTEHGAKVDEWPALSKRVLDADILVLGTPLWLGEESSICRVIIERLYALSGLTNDKGQYVFYGRTGGCIVTGNEDGVKHASMTVLYALQHVGYAIPPQADSGWIGEAGPGPSYGDKLEDGSRAGLDNAFTKRNTTFMTWNLMHMAHMLKDQGGMPAWGNMRTTWDEGEHFGHPGMMGS
jgi:multimeric flavodoxin WrbA